MRRLLLAVALVGCSSRGSAIAPSDDASALDAAPDAAPDTALDAAPDTTPTPDAPSDSPPDAPLDAGFVHAPNVNAMRDGAGILPLYPSHDGSIAFRRGAADVTALREDGSTIWTGAVREGSLFGGFDLDADGVPDFGVAARESAGETCGATAMQNTWLELHAGATGARFAATTKTKDLCWTFGATTYPTQQWTDLGVLFGADSKTIALLPYYASIGQYATWGGASLAYDELDYPSTAAFDLYTAAKTNAYGTGKHTTNPHVANGLIMTVGAEPRLLFFTSSRVVQYAIGPRSLAQLRVDHPFLTAGRTDLVGRDYGLVARDPGDEGLVLLLSGTSAQTVYSDMVTGKMEADPWGQIERHVTVYDPRTDALDDRFFSYAHDGGDAYKYEGRVVYPDHPFLRRAGRSRAIYDVYAGGHWWVHVSQPGATADAWTTRGVFVWDVRDLDGDGVDEIVSSTVEDPTDPDVSGYYFPKWRTVLSHLSADETILVTVKSFDGAIPELIPFFRDPKRTTSYSALYPVLTVSEGGKPKLVLRKPDGTRLFVDP
jgi:hypothetical protein